ncbi:MAG: VWA domain-containing protein [Desulfobulbales bacterium]|nr:VWA domain-containing protein [Desulfobulbales bacterium]
MNVAELKENFFALVPSHPPNSWEIEEHLADIAELETGLQKLVLAQVPALWPVSHSLCYSYLAAAGNAMGCLPADRMIQWVGNILDIYEKDGLRAAQHFMADVEANFLCRIRGEAGFSLRAAAERLQTYARSITARNITLAAGPHIYTDTESVYLPGKLTLFSADADNFLLYKLIVTFQLGIIQQGTYAFDLPAEHALIRTLAVTYGKSPETERLRLAQFFALFPDARLAEDTFTIMEAQRISGFIASTFPGLWRDTARIRSELAASRLSQAEFSQQSRVLETLARHVITGRAETVSNAALQSLNERVLAEYYRPAATSADSAAKAAAVYAILHGFRESYEKIPPVYFVGRLNPAEARKAMLRRRQTTKEEFIKILATVITRANRPSPGELAEENIPQARQSGSAGEEGTAMLQLSRPEQKINHTAPEKAAISRFITLDNPALELPEPLGMLADEIVADLGSVPSEYIAAAQGMAGRAPPTRQAASSPEGNSLTAPITYDEWDFRRNGYRKNWCQLLEKELQPVRGTFVDTTLDKYKGLLRQLKKQFEMLRSSDRFVKRQRDGDEIDLDAMIESISDTRAGKPQSERLFIRLQRDERDIAVLFLVDMSSSTEGWINKALKEALILMGEALQVLGDRFAIYGFSGMRRTRSDFYRVKDFAEPYNEEIKGRIAAVGPQEYTRMGPPLRHAVELLRNVEAKVRLLVTLSDGKPEDYDDYKGEYAIEDTRHALIEAKAAGIHPFCITIDKQAHDYIGHMYGEVNYIFVDEVRKLPVRLPEIYRVLTT